MKILKVDGKDYLVHYSINSLVRMEQETGKGFVDMFDENEISIGTIRDLIFYGLISKQRNFKEEDAGQLMDRMIEDGKSIADISQMFIKELTNALGMKIEEDTNEVGEEVGDPN